MRNLRDFYNGKITELSIDLKRRKGKTKWFITTEISLFAIATGIAVAFFAGHIEPPAFIFSFSTLIAAFTYTKITDRRNCNECDKTEARLNVYRGNLKYLDGDFSTFDDGKRYENPNHQYTFDMDIFGKESLYNRICRTVTTGGSDRLANILSSAALCPEAQGASIDSIRQRNRAIAELAKHEEWRTDFLSSCGREKIDTHLIKDTLHSTRNAHIPQQALSKVRVALVYAAIATFAILLLLTIFTPLSADFVCIWTVVQLGISIISNAKAIKMISKAVDKISLATKACISLIQLVSDSQFTEEGNRKIVNTLNEDNNAALSSLKELKDILDALDRRGNVLGLIIFNAIGWSDFFLVRRYLKWQQRNISAIEKWVDALSEMDAMVSMATMIYNEPQSKEPELVESEKLIYEAKGLYHPFLGENAVKNDFSIKDRNYYIITGANMAGKSTFLRSIGINYILAMCGMTIFAEGMKVSVFSLFSSMRTSDDLAHGISYFNAELLRLRLLLDNVRKNRHTLIILDEILKGTNSLDKLNGSRMFLEAVTQLPVTGIIATHDLELSKMAEEHPDRFHNYCFEIKLSDEITYTYKITPGVAKNQNATYLLRNILTN